MQVRAPDLVETGAVGSRAETRDAEFTAYLDARQAALMRTAYLVVGDRHQAEDVLQTALAKLYLSWDKVRDRESVDAYVRRIIVNEHHSVWRRGFKRREQVTAAVPEDRPHHDVYDEGLGDEVWRLVQTLPRKARAVLVLRYYEQLTEAETADVLGVTVGTVKSQTSRALGQLRERTPATLHPRSAEEDR